ncbi:adenine deaminase [Desmospora activa]|uniref:Adenine deaminase n=1 Tax=Desmospora activa DSM 45169 TaxID=1121389 RepID=A0A2T4ZDV8_9BACL|nr:adenine deaminase [Desmospora activa]PTM60054.1 adenine deaminase [Desmospora activa DSM 45169]
MKDDLISAARGDVQLDVAIQNVKMVNVFTGEVYPAAIGIKQDRIAHVTAPGETHLDAATTIDGNGAFAIPGWIDTHVHIESSMLTPAAYAEAVLPHGTTTVATDPHEIANVLGEEGVRYMVEASRELDLRVLTFLPSCVPSAPGLETAGADFTPAVIARMLAWEEIDGLAEVMNYPGVIQQDERMMGILAAWKQSGKSVQGHAPTVSGRDLSAYLMAGVNSDHESRTGEEALEKIRAGMFVEIRESSFSLNAGPIAATIKDKGYLPNVCLCSDDVKANHLLERGHINHVARRLIEEGIEPIDAIRYGTLNAARRLNRSDLGAIAVGYRADIVLVNDLQSLQATDVWVNGKAVVRESRLTRPQSRVEAPAYFFETVRVGELQPKDFAIRVDTAADTADIRVIEYDYAPGIPTDFMPVTLPVQNGEVMLEDYQGRKGPLNRIGVFHRHGGNQNRFVGVLAGYGVVAGAVATTVAHDSHHLAVLGTDPADMALAGNLLREKNGGMIAVHAGEVIAELPLPLAGLMSERSAHALAPDIDTFVERLQQTIMPGKNPIHRLIAVTLPVIPRAKITDLGLVDVDRQRLVPLVITAK